jgi:hypothetical protein
MADSYSVIIAALEAHARTLSGLSTELTTAQQKAESVALPGGTYGESAEQAAALLRGHTFVGRATLTSAVAALDAAVTNLRANAADYRATEQQNKDQLNKSGSGR